MYRSLNLNAAANEQCGIGYQAVKKGEHLWQWKAEAPSRPSLDIDLQRAATRQCGPDYKVIHTGIHAYDWAAFAPVLTNYYIVPVMQIAADMFYDIAAVRQALENFNSGIASVREFYRLQTGKTFRLLPPICQYTPLTALQWYDLAQLSLYDSHRAEYGDKAIELLRSGFGGAMNTNLIYLVTQFCGPNPTSRISPYGAINRGNISIVPATACLEERTVSDKNDFPALYAIGHELGHAFGLPHSDMINPRPDNYGDSLMLWGWNGRDKAILLDSEKQKLLQTPYFF